jgi:hypothetical protein
MCRLKELESVIWAILSKEFHQHRFILVILPILMTLSWGLYTGRGELTQSGGSQFYNLTWFLFLLFPLFALVVANALIADEYRQRTQIFLEGLPAPRWVFLVVKYFTGLLIITLSALVLLIVLFWLEWSRESLTSRFTYLLTLKTLLWAWFLWSGFFTFAFLGRYRIALGMIAFLIFMFLENELELGISRFGPFDLIGSKFAYERIEIPTDAIGYTLALICIFTATGFSFGLARDATLANMLSEKMSFREKISIAVIFFGCIATIGSVAEQRKSTEQLNLPGSIELEYKRGIAHAAPSDIRPSAEVFTALEAHLQSSCNVLDEMAEYLRIERLPKLFIVHRPDYGSGKFEVGQIDTRQGVLIRFNAIETNPKDQQWIQMLVRSVLLAHQHNRLDSDSRDWIVTGFSVWWPARNDTDWIDHEVATRQVNEEATEGERKTEVVLKDLLAWKAYKKKTGDVNALHQAGMLIRTLRRKSEPESIRDFFSEVLGYHPPYDFRAAIHDYWYSVESVLKRRLNLTLKDLVTQEANP